MKYEKRFLKKTLKEAIKLKKLYYKRWHENLNQHIALCFAVKGIKAELDNLKKKDKKE